VSSTPTPPGLAGREIIIEFIEVGNAVRVAAIDAATGEEAVIQAGKHSPRSEMERVVLAQLARKLGLGTNKKRPGEKPGRGIKV
tara:strand:- start:910 stop:1161 length:252 start_codon:yes stop_codon:yes gene_type:complete